MQVSTSKKLCKRWHGLAPLNKLHVLTSYVAKNAEKTVDLLGIFMSVSLSLTRMDLMESATKSERGSSCQSQLSDRR